MTSSPVQHIASRDNAQLKELRRLAQDNTAYRKQGRIWLEGDHLCRAALERGVRPMAAVFSETSWSRGEREWDKAASRILVVSDELFATVSALESPGHMGCIVELPHSPQVDAAQATVVLDGLQDAGNVGNILRAAAALGYAQVLAIKGTAALWSPKALRAGMGAHFGLRLIEQLAPEVISTLSMPVFATSSHRGEFVHKADLPWPCAWVFGHEGQGVGEAAASLATRWVRIIQPGGEESLNVAAAAAICLHAAAAANYTDRA